MIEVPEGYVLIKKEDYDNLLKLVSNLMLRIAELEGRSRKTSKNSSKPPSSDGLKRTVKNNRERTGKKPGGQPGHAGSNLKMVDVPDKVIAHKLEGFCSCGEDLNQLPIIDLQSRQVIDLPEKLREVTEHQVEIKRCSCGKLHEAKCDFKNHVQYGNNFKSMMVYLSQYQFIPYARLQEFCKDWFDIKVSDGFLVQNNVNCYSNLEQTVESIKAGIMVSPVINNDETGSRCESKTQWIHSTSTPDLTYVTIHAKRGTEAIDEIGILNEYKGISVHDRWSSYDKYLCDHSLCNAHLLRDLKGLIENTKSIWAESMIKWLVKTNDYKKQGALDIELIQLLENEYCKILGQGLKEEPPDPVPLIVKRGRKAKSKSQLLLDVFINRSENVMMFMYNPDVPFDNNLAERDLRMVKLKQKVSGSFRSKRGADAFCSIRSYISTVRKQGNNIVNAIKMAIKKEPLVVYTS